MNARRAELERQEVQARLVDDAQHLAEQHIDMAVALLDDGVEPEAAGRSQNRIGTAMKQADESDGGGDEEVHDRCDLHEDLLGLFEQGEPDVAQVGAQRLAAAALQGRRAASASAVSGSTSACALSVSISTARLDCTIF